jgi:hypothetical protein
MQECRCCRPKAFMPSVATLHFRSIWDQRGNCLPSLATVRSYRILQRVVFDCCPFTRTFGLDQVKQLFEEALLLDPRHGPAYNACQIEMSLGGSCGRAKKLANENYNRSRLNKQAFTQDPSPKTKIQVFTQVIRCRCFTGW